MIRSRKAKPNRSLSPMWHGIEASQSTRLDIDKIIKGDPSHQIVLGIGGTWFTKSDSLGQVGQCVSDQVYAPKARRWYARKSLATAAKTGSGQDGMQEDHSRFISEIKNLRLLRHKHIARLAGSYTDVERIAYLMEPVSDTTLDMFLEGGLNHDARILLRHSFGCLAAALGHIHGHSLHIKQLSSENISVHHGKLFISGFGALVQNPAEAMCAAPELREPRDVDGYSRDVWALGVIYLKILMRLHGVRPSEFCYWVHIYSQGASGVDREDSLITCVDRFKTFVQGQGRPRYQHAATWTSALLQEEPHKRPNCQDLLDMILDSRQSQEFCCQDCRRACAGSRSRQEDVSFGLTKAGHETLRGLLACMPYIGSKPSHKNYHAGPIIANISKTRIGQIDEAKTSLEQAKHAVITENSGKGLSSKVTPSAMLGFVEDSEEVLPVPIKKKVEATTEGHPMFASGYDHEGKASACPQPGEGKSKSYSCFSPPQPLQVTREPSPAPSGSNLTPKESDEVVAENLSRNCVHGRASAVRAHLEEALERRLDSACQEAWFSAVCGTSKEHSECVRVFLETAGNDFVQKTENKPGRRTALLLAADNPNFEGTDLEERVELLIEHGADTNTVDSQGDHMLAKLIRRGGDTSRTIEAIARSPTTDLNKPAGESEDSPLHLAVEQVNVAVVSLLLHLRANVDPVNAKGLTPLEAAVLQVYKTPGMRVSQEQAEVLKALMDFGANTDRVTRFYLAKEEGIA